MPIARFQMPDGRVARFEVPEGTTPEQAQAMMQEAMPKEAPTKNNYDGSPFANGPLKIGKEGFADSLKEVLADQNWLTRNIAGAGAAASNMYYGGKQLVGAAYDALRPKNLSDVVAGKKLSTINDRDAIENNKIIEGSAPVGSFLGNAALAAVPFGMAGASLKAAGAVGAGMGALQPVSGQQTLENVAQGKAINTGVGAVTGTVGQAVANKAGSVISNKLAELQALKQQRAPIDSTIKEAVDAGYVIPPGNVDPSFANRVLESVGGKIATQQMAAERNQSTTDALARSAAGLSKNDPITPKNLAAVRSSLGKAYDDVGKVVGQDTVEQLKTLRADANDLWKMQARNPHPETLAMAKQKTQDAANLESTIDQVLTAAGKQDTMKAFREARKKIAINHAVENALVEGGGTIDARTIARATQRGDVQSGELATIGNFANNFPKITQPDKMVGTPDAHNLKYVSSLLMGAGGTAAAGGPVGLIAGALPMVSGPAARALMFRKAAQQGLLSDYSLGLGTRATGGLLKHSPVILTAGGLEALP